MTPSVYTHRNSQNWLPNLFNEIFNDNFFGISTDKAISAPAINVIENEKNFTIELAAPGMTRNDFKVNLDKDNELTISLEKKNEEDKSSESGHYIRKEFSYSSYTRTFIVPENVNMEGITASMNDGILSVTLPKKEEKETAVQSRQIEIC